MAWNEGQEKNRLILAILKFSFTTTAAERAAPLEWTQLSGGKDLMAVFETVQVRDNLSKWSRSQRIFKVLRGNEVLEEVDLRLLAQTTSGSHLSSQNSGPCVAIVVKPPCVAIRYPTAENQIRRFQIKFSSEADYYKAVSELVDARCPVAEPSIINTRGISRSSQGAGVLPSSSMSPSPTQEAFSLQPPQNHATPPGPVSFGEIRQSSMGPPATSSITRTSCSPAACSPAQTSPSHSEKEYRRPLTAPSLLDVESLSQLLPPKRELPFSKSPKKMGPNLCPPTPLGPKRVNIGPVAELVGVPNQPVQNSPTFRAIAPKDVSRSCVPSPGMFPPQNPTERIQQGNLEDTNNRIVRPHLPSPSLSPEKRPYEGNGGNNPVELATVRTQGVDSGSTSIPRVEPQPQQQGATETPQPAHQSIPIGTGARTAIRSEDIFSYLSQPDSERSALVETWICEQLQSDEFLALCQEMEGVWRRLAFGL
ncbi:hypothetical protein FQN57_004034 [Myotisia sp. PD_48]|nr:hypothetical protein FQN57_004034 [Myotisia sp. PD_48]